MKLKKIVELLDGKLLIGDLTSEKEFNKGYAADLLSDVLALTGEETVLITGTVSPQVARVAEILNIPLLIFVRGKEPHEKIIEHAQKIDLPIILTKKTMFETCGLLYAAGMVPCKNVSVE